MSLLIYLIAFLYQVSLRPANRLTTESISVIFGPSLLGTSKADTNVTNGVNSSKASAEGLRWLLDNWEDSLSQDLLDEDYDCFASPYVGQTAWSTPNLLGEMQPNPFSRSKDGAGLAQDAQAASARSPDGTSNLEDTDLSPGARIEMPDSEPVQTADHGIGLDQDNRSPDTHNAGQGVAHTQNPKSGLRSVSGFAKGENISDDDIASDPNAAQLFGSLSQLFNSERRKAKAYQQQVQELQTQQAEYTSTIKDLQNTLAQRNMDMNGLQSEIGALNSRIAKLESEVSEALSTSQSYHDSVREAQRALEEKERLHTSTLEAKQNEIGVLGQKHQEELERQRVEHSRTLNRELSALQEQHSGEKEQEAIARKKVHEEELAHIRSEHETERGQLIEEIRQLREAIQVSDKDRDAARAHLQRIRTLLDSA